MTEYRLASTNAQSDIIYLDALVNSFCDPKKFYLISVGLGNYASIIRERYNRGEFQVVNLAGELTNHSGWPEWGADTIAGVIHKVLNSNCGSTIISKVFSFSTFDKMIEKYQELKSNG